MSNKAIRFLTPDQPYDEWDKQAKLMNFGVAESESKWSTVAGNESRRAIQYKINTYVPDCQLELDLNFPAVFTVCFWAKVLGDISSLDFMLVLDASTQLATQIATPDNEWHYYAVSRDISGDIRMFIDGVTEPTIINSTVALNFGGNSYVFLGDAYADNTVVVDDLCIVEGTLYTADFTLPVNYIDLSAYRSYLVIEISTGKVWGYA